MAWLAAKPASNCLQLSLLEGGLSLALHQMCHAAFSSQVSSISLIDVLPCLSRGCVKAPYVTLNAVVGSTALQLQQLQPSVQRV